MGFVTSSVVSSSLSLETGHNNRVQTHDYNTLSEMASITEQSGQLKTAMAQRRFDEKFAALPTEIQEMVWKEFENVPRPCMYTLLGFVRMDHEPIRQHVDEVLTSLSPGTPSKLKPKYRAPSCDDDCYSNFFDMFQPERDILFLPNRRTDGPDWMEEESSKFCMDYRNFASVRYMAYRVPYRNTRLSEVDIDFLSNFPLLRVLWVEHSDASEMPPEVQKFENEIDEILALAIIEDGREKVNNNTWGDFLAGNEDSGSPQCLSGAPKPGFEHLDYQVPQIKFLTKNQMAQLCGNYQMSISGDVEEENIELNEELEEGEIDETIPVKTYGVLRENINPNFDILTSVRSGQGETNLVL